MTSMQTIKAGSQRKSKTKVPEREKWLFENKPALKKVKQGLSDSAKGKVKSRGSFVNKWLLLRLNCNSLFSIFIITCECVPQKPSCWRFNNQKTNTRRPNQ